MTNIDRTKYWECALCGAINDVGDDRCQCSDPAIVLDDGGVWIEPTPEERDEAKWGFADAEYDKLQEEES